MPVGCMRVPTLRPHCPIGYVKLHPEGADLDFCQDRNSFLCITGGMSPDDRTSELLQRAQDTIEAAERVRSNNACLRAHGYELALKTRDTAELLRRMQEDATVRPQTAQATHRARIASASAGSSWIL